jgi:hypothetical protein
MAKKKVGKVEVIEKKKGGGCWGGILTIIITGVGAFCLLVLVIAALDALGFIESEEGGGQNVVISSRTPAGEPSETPIPLPTDTPEPSDTPIPLPTNTLIPSNSRRIEDVFMGINVLSVELASEVERENQINGLAMVTIEDDANLYVVRDSLWTTWVYHAQRTYSDDKRLVLDLTIIQAGTESIWQRTSGETRWLQLGGTVPTVEAQKTGLTSLPRPDNCDEAVAWGYTAQQAAQWSHLDRDGDGVACYGD